MSKIDALAACICAATVLAALGPARAQSDADLLNSLRGAVQADEKAATTRKDLPIPSPNKVLPSVTGESSKGETGARINANREESLRIEREILERLPQQ